MGAAACELSALTLPEAGAGGALSAWAFMHGGSPRGDRHRPHRQPSPPILCLECALDERPMKATRLEALLPRDAKMISH